MTADARSVPDKQKTTSHAPLKDENDAHPVANAWRPALAAVVDALARGDDADLGKIPSVTPPSAKALGRMRQSIGGHGGTLRSLPQASWDSSVAQGMRTHWEVVVDLWTVEAGRSDLVLSGRVVEADSGYRVEIDSVHVPRAGARSGERPGGR